MSAVLWKLHSAVVNGESREEVEDATEQLLRLLKQENGVVEHRSDVTEVAEGPRKGSFVVTLDYAKPTRYL